MFCEEEEGILVTYVVIDIDNAFYNHITDGYTIIRHEGGEIEDIGLWVSDQPVFNVGEEVIVFVQEDLDTGYMSVAGLFQGKFTVENGIVVENGLTVRDFAKIVLGQNLDDDLDAMYCRIYPLGYEWYSMPVTFYANSAGTRDCTGEFSALLKGGRVWNQVSACYFRFASGGKNSGTAPVYDGKNQLQWLNKGSSYIAACYIWYSGNRIMETDIVMNDYYKWSAQVSGCPGDCMDVQNIGAHELGHSVGCEDSYAGGCSHATMYGYASYGQTIKRSLADEDKACAREIYPD
jgi:hypothetical protein